MKQFGCKLIPRDLDQNLKNTICPLWVNIYKSWVYRNTSKENKQIEGQIWHPNRSIPSAIKLNEEAEEAACSEQTIHYPIVSLDILDIC